MNEFSRLCELNWASMWKTQLLIVNKRADQPVHPRSLISTFVVDFLIRIINGCTFYGQNFDILASLCSWTDWFQSVSETR